MKPRYEKECIQLGKLSKIEITPKKSKAHRTREETLRF